MEIIGIGTDILQIKRLSGLLSRHKGVALTKLFTDSEIEYCSGYSDRDVRLAGRFAAKEAVAKALGTGMTDGVSFFSISIESGSNYEPYVVLSGKASEIAKSKGIKQIKVSISHESEYAVAFAVAVGFSTDSRDDNGEVLFKE